MTNKNNPKKNKPNESGNVRIEAHLKIWDPKTNEIIINQRTE